MSEPPIAGLILAAGASRRMGTPKALLRIQGETFLDRLIGVFSHRLSPVIAVGGQAFSLPSRPAVTFAINPDPERGMLSSLQCGLQELPSTSAGVVFTPVDYPAIRSATVERIIAAFRSHACDVVIPVCGEIHGHPVCVSRRVIHDLLKLPVTAQARDTIRQYRDRTVFVEVEDPGITADVDTPEDYQRSLEMWHRHSCLCWSSNKTQSRFTRAGMPLRTIVPMSR
ncbi:MAG: nucleotidyltransferase family protein [Bryobacteraceae bacterium]